MPRMRVYQTLAEKQAAYRRRQGIPERPHYPSHAAKIAAYRQRKRQRRRSAWTTPPDLFHKLDQEFHFTLDVAADPDNALCPRYYTPQDDGLAQPWEGVCWCNPPYGRGEIARWVQKASESAQAGATVVCLLPVRTATQWWHTYVYEQAEIRFVRGRLKFSGLSTNARENSAVVIFRPPPQEQAQAPASVAQDAPPVQQGATDPVQARARALEQVIAALTHARLAYYRATQCEWPTRPAALDMRQRHLWRSADIAHERWRALVEG